MKQKIQLTNSVGKSHISNEVVASMASGATDPLLRYTLVDIKNTVHVLNLTLIENQAKIDLNTKGEEISHRSNQPLDVSVIKIGDWIKKQGSIISELMQEIFRQQEILTPKVATEAPKAPVVTDAHTPTTDPVVIETPEATLAGDTNEVV